MNGLVIMATTTTDRQIVVQNGHYGLNDIISSIISLVYMFAGV
jgi:hypothetical protein